MLSKQTTHDGFSIISQQIAQDESNQTLAPIISGTFLEIKNPPPTKFFENLLILIDLMEEFQDFQKHMSMMKDLQ